jgi:hypothetical protein
VGLAQSPIADDPTLRPGDIIATHSGLTVYSGRSRDQEMAFTPIDSARMSKSMRARLADVRIAPARETTGSAPADDGEVNAAAQ